MLAKSLHTSCPKFSGVSGNWKRQNLQLSKTRSSVPPRRRAQAWWVEWLGFAILGKESAQCHSRIRSKLANSSTCGIQIWLIPSAHPICSWKKTSPSKTVKKTSIQRIFTWYSNLIRPSNFLFSLTNLMTGRPFSSSQPFAPFRWCIWWNSPTSRIPWRGPVGPAASSASDVGSLKLWPFFVCLWRLLQHKWFQQHPGETLKSYGGTIATKAFGENIVCCLLSLQITVEAHPSTVGCF